MKKTLELLSNKEKVKKSAMYGSLLALFFFVVAVICLRLGIGRWKTYDDPMTWSELYLKSPQLALLWMGLSVFFFFAFLHDKGGSSGRSTYFICTRCLNIHYHYQVKNNECPDCCSKVEILDGFYDRHPELKNRKRKKTKL